jgi:hypothetical protein
MPRGGAGIRGRCAGVCIANADIHTHIYAVNRCPSL